MRRIGHTAVIAWAIALPWLGALIGGCASDGCGKCGSWWGSLCGTCTRVPPPPAPVPPPFGSSVRNFQTAMAAKADAADFTIFLDEWFQGGPKLGPFGQRHLLALIAVMNQIPTPVLVQCCTDPELDQARRLYLVEQLSINGVAEPDRRVVLGFPDAEGLDGEYSERIYLTMLRGSGYLLNRNGFRSGILPGLGGLGGYGGGYGGLGFIGGAGGVGGFGLPFGGLTY